MAEVVQEKPEPAVRPLLTIEDVSQVLGVHRNTVKRLIRCTGLPTVKFGHRSVRIRPEALEAWLEDVELGPRA